MTCSVYTVAIVAFFTADLAQGSNLLCIAIKKKTIIKYLSTITSYMKHFDTPMNHLLHQILDQTYIEKI